jgi:hypothetical protein
MSVTGWLGSRAIVRLEGLGELKNVMSSLLIAPTNIGSSLKDKMRKHFRAGRTPPVVNRSWNALLLSIFDFLASVTVKNARIWVVLPCTLENSPMFPASELWIVLDACFLTFQTWRWTRCLSQRSRTFPAYTAMKLSRSRYSCDRQVWQWLINITITILDIIHRPAFFQDTTFQRLDSVSGDSR